MGMKTKEQVQKEGLVAKCGGTVYTIEEFFKYVKTGSFIPYDGIGHFHDGEQETKRSVWATDLSLLELKKYPYVCWYNK